MGELAVVDRAHHHQAKQVELNRPRCGSACNRVAAQRPFGIRQSDRQVANAAGLRHEAPSRARTLVHTIELCPVSPGGEATDPHTAATFSRTCAACA